LFPVSVPKKTVFLQVCTVLNGFEPFTDTFYKNGGVHTGWFGLSSHWEYMTIEYLYVDCVFAVSQSSVYRSPPPAAGLVETDIKRKKV